MKAGAGHQPNDLFFATPEGGPLMPRHLKRRHFRPIFKSAKLPQSFRLYDLRHSCATLLLAAGEHPKVVSERLGHARAGPITWTVRSKLMTATGRSFGAKGTSFSETRHGTCTLAAGTRTVSSTAVAATSLAHRADGPGQQRDGHASGLGEVERRALHDHQLERRGLGHRLLADVAAVRGRRSGRRKGRGFPPLFLAWMGDTG